MSLSRSLQESFPSWAKNVAAIKFKFPAQLFDELLVLSYSLIMNLGRLIERCPELSNLLIVDLGGLIERRLELVKLPGELVQELVAFTGIGRP
jgi:hypothetical protein